MRTMVCGVSTLAFLAAAGAAWAQSAAPVDSGSYTIYAGDQALGTEIFVFARHGDSLVVSSLMVEVPNPPQPDTLHKRALLVLKGEDFDLRSYESQQAFVGQRLQRRLTMSDTSFTSFFQVNERGQADELVRPPGRIFVLDPQVFALYDVICRNFHGRIFDRRPITLLALGLPDTTLEATVTDLGPDTLRWAGRPVRARKLQISDPGMEFFLWIAPQGHMLRLTQPAYGIRVERAPPPVKRRPRRSR